MFFNTQTASKSMIFILKSHFCEKIFLSTFFKVGSQRGFRKLQKQMADNSKLLPAIVDINTDISLREKGWHYQD